MSSRTNIENFLAKPVEPDEMIEKLVRFLQNSETKHDKERQFTRSIRQLQETIDAAKQ